MEDAAAIAPLVHSDTVKIYRALEKVKKEVFNNTDYIAISLSG